LGEGGWHRSEERRELGRSLDPMAPKLQEPLPLPRTSLGRSFLANTTTS
jgi:hypothetical protein